MADTRIKSWTISAGAVGKKAVRRSFGNASPAMRITASQRLTMISWNDGGCANNGRLVWGSVLSTLVNAE